MPKAEGVIRAIRVTLDYFIPGHNPVSALHDVSLDVPAAAITAVAGPSGSGKSSLLRLLAAVERPTSGTILFEGVDIASSAPRVRRKLRRHQIGFAPSHASTALASRSTVANELAVAAAIRGAPSDWQDRARDRLDALGLADRWHARTEQLSSGEQHRVTVVAALVGEPRLVLADEPTAALDGHSAAALLAQLHATANRGTAVVVATHDLAVIDRADVVLRLHAGEIEPS